MTPANCARWRVGVGKPCACGRHTASGIRGADCHPDRPNIAGGLCANCYAKQRRWSERPESWRPRGCHGHACDGCRTCIRGICCRSDDQSYKLPSPSDIPVAFGALGTLEEDASGQRCHLCGDWFRALHKHVYHTHDLTPDEYRSAFGLAYGQSLYALEQRRAHGDVLKPWQGNAEWLAEVRPTPEQQSVWSSRPERLQVRRRKRPMRDRLAATVLRNAPRPETHPNTATCPICGDEYAVPPSTVKRGRRTCARQECRRAWLAQHRKVPGNAKLTAEQAAAIRRMEGSQTQIAAAFGISQSLVSLIKRGVVWPERT